MILRWIVIAALCRVIVTSIHVQQMYPSNTTYGCPGKPSLVLNCTFPTDVAVVSWSCTGVAGIPDNYPGHQIDNNMFHSGISLLSVTDPSQLKQVYRCIIFHRDGTSEEMHRTVSIPADFNLTFSVGSVDETSIYINWTWYFDCFTFSVYMDNKTLLKNELVTNYTMVNLSPSTSYNVCVAGQDRDGNKRSNWRHCANITTTTTITIGPDFDCHACSLLYKVLPPSVAVVICLLVVLIISLMVWKQHRRAAPSQVISGRIDDDTMHQTNAENSAKRDRNDGITIENKDTVVTGISPNAATHSRTPEQVV